jgi:tetratricopeptide (TPR) repeat protein
MVPVFIALLFQYSTFNLQFYNAHKRWKSTNEDSETVEECTWRYPYLQDNIKFLFEYTQSLSALKQYDKSNEILHKAMQISCEPMLYIIMGENCQALKEYKLAEQNFVKAANIVPNRLYPHYMLAKLYHEMGLKDMAEMEINIVLTKSPKVESVEVEEMRRELVKLLTE